MTRLRRLIAPPMFEDAEKAQRALILHRVVVTTMAIASPILALIPLVQSSVWIRAVIALSVVNGLGTALLAVNRRGHTELASKVMVGGLVALVTAMGFTAGGVRSPGVTMYFLFVVMAGLLLGQRAGIRLAFLCATLSLGMVVIEKAGYLPEPWAPYRPETFWLLNCLYLGLTLALLRIATDALAGTLRRVESELRERRIAEAEREEADRRRRESESQLRQSQKMEALGTLAGGIAHDFNNILTAIVGNAELARQELDPSHPATAAMHEITRASARAAGIVKSVLVFSRRQDVEHKSMSLLPVVDEAIKLMRFSLPKDIQVRTAYASDIPPISGDASQLYQVFVNVATNAAHAMAARGGDLIVSVDSIELGDAEAATSPDLRAGRHFVRVVVRDTGMGMSRATIERAFEPFFTTKGHGGTGLGLSVVHGIVKEHHGAITLESEVGKGTTVRLYLPAVAPETSNGARVAAADDQGGGERIMYVDDEEMLLDIMTRSLKVLGYRCTAYVDPVAAVKDFRANPGTWSAVITDLSMPAMSGLELARELRVIRPDIRIALVSGYAQDAAQVAQAGITLRLQKPYTIDTLGQALHELLRRPAAQAGALQPATR